MSKSGRTNPKVVRLSDRYDVASSAAFAPRASAPAPVPAPVSGVGRRAAEAGGYEPLKVMGEIKEKGFQSNVRVSAPEPRVTAFPVARHRSEGPHWAPCPVNNVMETEEIEEDREVNGAESVAGLARPLTRKIKSGIEWDLVRKKQELSEPRATITEIQDETFMPTVGVAEALPELEEMQWESGRKLQQSGKSRATLAEIEDEKVTFMEAEVEPAPEQVDIQGRMGRKLQKTSKPKATVTEIGDERLIPILVESVPNQGDIQQRSGRKLQELSTPKATVAEMEDEAFTPMEGVVESVPKEGKRNETTSFLGERHSLTYAQLAENAEGSETMLPNIPLKIDKAQSSNKIKELPSSYQSGADFCFTAPNVAPTTLTHETPSRFEVDENLINVENLTRIQNMSETEIEEVQMDLHRRLRPEIVEMLKRRGEAKVKSKHKDPQNISKPIVDEHMAEMKPSSFSYSTEEKMVTPVVSLHRQMQHLDPGKGDKEDIVSQKSYVQSSAEVGRCVGKTWTERVEAARLEKFDLNGNIITSEFQSEANYSVVERDFLRSEGDPAREGYSLKEATTLVRSTVPGQRAAALRLIASILDRSLMGLQSSSLQESCEYVESGSEKKTDWQAIWAYALGPEPQLGLTLRLSLDDSHATVVAASARALEAMLSCSSNEYYFHLLETSPGEPTIATAPIFRKRPRLEDGFIGGDFWKYNVKSSNLNPFQGKSSQEIVEEEENSTVGDDSAIVNQDVAAGFIRMGILPRIRYIIEVEQLAAAEEPLLNVLIALARHSPRAGELVIKCPRLMEAITQQFLLNNANTNAASCVLRAKASQLIKVLAGSSKRICILLAKSGTLQAAMSDLFKGAFSSNQRRSEESFNCLAAPLIEALKLWRTCVKYQVGLSWFSDLYAALCYWLSPPSLFYSCKSPDDNDMLSLAQESYLLLGELARTLPVLHAHDQFSGGASDQVANSIELSWSWSVALPLIETSMSWLSSECSSIIEKLTGISEESSTNLSTLDRSMKPVQSYIGVLTAVLDFLSVVSEKISSGKEHLEMLKDNPFLLPSFICRLRLCLVTSNLLGFWKTDRSETHLKTSSTNTPSTLVDWFLKLKNMEDHETLLVLVSCIHAFIRLAYSLDTLLKAEKLPVHDKFDMEQLSTTQTVLRYGILVAAESELQELLVALEDEVIGNQLLQESEFNGRGGPAPGVGLGWGSKHGGVWSIQSLLAQKYAQLTKDLVLILPKNHELYKDQPPDLCFAPSKQEIAVLRRRIASGFAAMMLTGPGKAHLLEQVLSDVLLDSEVYSSLVRCCQLSVGVWLKHRDRKDGSRNGSHTTVLTESDIQKGRNILLQHFRAMWLVEKNKLDEEDIASIDSSRPKIQRLATIAEEPSQSEDEIFVSHSRGQMTEWVNTRLPLQNHWLLSPFSTSLEQFQKQIVPMKDECNMDECKQASMEDLVKSGLTFLLGLETIMDQAEKSICWGVSLVSITRKIHALSALFVFGEDVFLQDDIRDPLGALQHLLGFHLDRDIISVYQTEKFPSGATYLESRCHEQNIAAGPGLLLEKPVGRATVKSLLQAVHSPVIASVHGKHALDFELLIDSSYVIFAENLAETFAASSFGDLNFGCQVAIYFRRGVAESIRLAMWKVLSDSKVLHLLPSLDNCIGHPFRYLYPAEDSGKVLDVYVSAWTSGALEEACDRHSLPFTLALHHIAAFLFKGVDHKDLQRNKTVRNLVRASARRQKQKSMLLQLLSYTSHKSLSYECTKLDFAKEELQDLENRFALLFESCAGDHRLLTEVQSLQKLLS